MPFSCICSSSDAHRRSAGRPDRRLHVIDIENLVGGGTLTEPRLRAWSDAYTALDLYRCGDHVAIGVDVTGAAVVMGALRSPRVVLGRGPDGADRALLRVLHDELDPARSYSELVLGSGDGIFADEVGRLTGRGLPVTLVARPGSLAKRLRLAGGREVAFPGSLLRTAGADAPVEVAA